METCYNCLGSGMATLDNGDPCICPTCKGDTVVPDDGKVVIELDLDDETIDYINSSAAKQGITIDEFIENALRRLIEEYE